MDMCHQSTFPFLATLLGRKHHFSKFRGGENDRVKKRDLADVSLMGVGTCPQRCPKVMVSREECRFFDGSGDFELSWIELT